MTFTQLMTLLAVIAGPLGVALGFGLSMWGDYVKVKREANNKQHEEAVLRALGLLAAANTVENQGRVLAYAAYLEASGRRPVAGQVQAGVDSFNSAMATLDRLILEADVLGPEGLGDIGRTLQARARDLSGVVNDMNKRFTDENAQEVLHKILPAFLEAIEVTTAQVRALLKSGQG